ncbi:hypothetical protein WBG78_28890 [Chryseolinea sp. T2]|uniref:hypothetical protein n=1 Tax=Chryseolinea sp. T2 TaxID=3129255 RepID=UPI003076C43A
MKTLVFFTALIAYMLSGHTHLSSDTITLVASTPADAELRKMLALDTVEHIDFIRWNIELTSKNSFNISLRYGVSQNGTPGFVGGGKTATFTGTYSVVSQPFGRNSKTVYKLTGGGRPVVALVKLNDNTFHILDLSNSLMRGNAAWSYTLSRKDPVPNDDTKVSGLVDAATILDEKSPTVAYVGRTPSAALQKDHSWPNVANTPKFKWKIVLKRSPNGSPAGYTMRRVNDRGNDTKGKWEIIQRNDAVYYKLEPDEATGPLMLLVADKNVVYFVDDNQRIYVGNGDFSYAINRSVTDSNKE